MDLPQSPVMQDVPDDLALVEDVRAGIGLERAVSFGGYFGAQIAQVETQAASWCDAGRRSGPSTFSAPPDMTSIWYWYGAGITPRQQLTVGCATPSAAASRTWVPPKNAKASEYVMLPLSPQQYSPVNALFHYRGEMPRHTVPDSLGERIRAMRKARNGMTQIQLAERAGVGQSAVSSLETGDSQWARGPNLIKIAAALEVSVLWLTTGRGDPQRPVGASTDDAAVIELLHSLSTANRAAWMATGHALLESQLDRPTTKADPFPGKRRRAVTA